MVGGGTPSTSNSLFWNGDINWFTPTEVGSKKYLHESKRKITQLGLKNSSAKILPSETLLLTSRAGIGDIGILKNPSATNQGFQSLLPKDNINGEFLYYLASTLKQTLLQFASGSTFLEITPSKIKSIQIPIPTIAEQTAIATTLSDMDALITALDKKIAKKKAIKQGAMQQLLTGKKRLRGFSEKWEEKKLGELGLVTAAGVDKTINSEDVAIRLLNYLDVFKRNFIYAKELSHWVTAKSEQITKCSIRKGDVFFTPSSEMPYDIAISAVAMEDISDAVYSYHIVRFRPFEDWDLKFRTYIFKTKFFLEQAETLCEGSGKRYVISLSKFREMKVYYPIDKSEQTAIARILSDMDNEIAALEAKRDKYKLLKSGMIQELLTGKIRLIEAVNKPQKTEVIELQLKKSSHNDQINEAVVISFLVHKFGTKDYPLSRFRYTKYAYLLHRQYEHEAKGFQKHAAGPYKPTNRYKGPENIALKNKYILKVGNPKSGKDAFIVNESIENALNYFTEWYGTDIQQWIEQFRYYKNDYLEVLATVDESIDDLEKQKKQISVNSIKEYIHSISQWKEKLDKPYFSDFNIQKAIEESYKLFGE